MWLGVLILQSHNIKLQKACSGQIYGLDWEWEHPHESGRSLLFSIPWTKNLRTGETERWSMIGRPLA